MPYVSSVEPATVRENQALNIIVTGVFDVYPDTVASCIYWQGGNALYPPTNAISVSSTKIECPIDPGLTAGETQVTVKVYRESATIPNLNYCYSHEGGALNEPGEYATFIVQSENTECNVNTVPYIDRITPTSARENQIVSMNVAGIFEVYADTAAACGFWQNGSYQGSTGATSVSPEMIECPLIYGLGAGLTQVTVQVYRNSATIPNLNYCYSHEGGSLNERGEYATFTMESENTECIANTVPYVSNVLPATVRVGKAENMLVEGIFEVYADTAAACGFWQNGSYQGSTGATSVSPEMIECPLKSDLAEGLTQVTVQVYRNSATIPNLNYCYSHEGGYLNEPGDFALFEILPDRSLVLADLIAAAVIAGNIDAIRDEIVTIFDSAVAKEEQAQIIAEAMMKVITDERLKWDINNNAIPDLQDSINILRIISGGE